MRNTQEERFCPGAWEGRQGGAADKMEKQMDPPSLTPGLEQLSPPSWTWASHLWLATYWPLTLTTNWALTLIKDPGSGYTLTLDPWPPGSYWESCPWVLFANLLQHSLVYRNWVFCSFIHRILKDLSIITNLLKFDNTWNLPLWRETYMDKIIDFIRSLNSKQYSCSCHHFDIKIV